MDSWRLGLRGPILQRELYVQPFIPLCTAFCFWSIILAFQLKCNFDHSARLQVLTVDCAYLQIHLFCGSQLLGSCEVPVDVLTRQLSDSAYSQPISVCDLYAVCVHLDTLKL